MKVEAYITVISEMRFNTQQKNTLTNYTKYDISTKKTVLLPVYYVKNGLLFTNRPHITNKIFGYS